MNSIYQFLILNFNILYHHEQRSLFESKFEEKEDIESKVSSLLTAPTEDSLLEELRGARYMYCTGTWEKCEFRIHV